MKLSETSLSRFWKNEWGKTPTPGYQNWWLWVVAVVNYCFSLQLGNWLWKITSPDFDPGANPPWYFIRQDFFQGLAGLAGLAIMLVLLVSTWRRYRWANLPILTITGIWMIPGIVKSALIYSRCVNFFDFKRAISGWPTFESYNPSSVRFNLIGLLVATGLAVLLFGLNLKPLRAWRNAHAASRCK